MEPRVGSSDTGTPSKVEARGFVLGLGAVLLLAVLYIHLALFVTMIGVNHLLGVLFLVNTVGALIALIGVLKGARWWGWALGIVMAGGAAVIKLAMDLSPSFAALLLGGHPPSASAGHAPAHVLTTTVLPTFMNLKVLGTMAIIIELVFVLVAIAALSTRGGGSSAEDR